MRHSLSCPDQKRHAKCIKSPYQKPYHIPRLAPAMSSNHENLVASMDAIRRNGAGAAIELKHEIHRLADWREHVKSNPLPFLVSAVSLGYFLIPAHSKSSNQISAQKPTNESTTPARPIASSSFTERVSDSIRSQVTTTAGDGLPLDRLYPSLLCMAGVSQIKYGLRDKPPRRNRESEMAS